MTGKYKPDPNEDARIKEEFPKFLKINIKNEENAVMDAHLE